MTLGPQRPTTTGVGVNVDLSDLSRARAGSVPLHGYLARPAGGGPWPAVVMVHEAFGLDAVMRRQADHLARLGYLTLAVDLFSAGGTTRCLIATVRTLRRGSGRAFTDVATARHWLQQSPDCTGKLGIIGFCMGGGFALLTAGDYDVAGVNYGDLPKDTDQLDATASQACPVVASYGQADRLMRGAAPRLKAALTRAGVEHDVTEYPGVGHAFLNDAAVGPRALRPLLRVANVGPRPEAALDAWHRIDTFFASHLSTPTPSPPSERLT